jgi:hypothetical protein
MQKFNLKPARRAKTPQKPMDVGNHPAKVPDILSKISSIVGQVVWASDFSHINYRDKTF